MLDYEYFENHYRLIAVDLRGQKELDADPKAIQQKEFVGKLKNAVNAIVTGESGFVLAIMEKIKKNKTKIISKNCKNLIKDGELWRTKCYYGEQRNKLLSQLKFVAKIKNGTTLRITKKNFQDEELLHELFLAFANNMSTDIKLNKTHLPKIIQSDGFLDALLSKFAGPLMKVTVLLAKNVLAPLATMAFASAINDVI